MTQPLPISVVVLTYNSAASLAECLGSVAGWAAEVFVVDSGSIDATLDIAAVYTDRIVSHPFEHYAAQRNWAQANLTLACEWVLHIDSDEHVSADLAHSLRQLFESPAVRQYNGLLISRRTVFMGRWIRHGGHYPVYHARLFRRTEGRCEDRLYDQHFTVNGLVARVKGDLIDTVTTDLDEWTRRHIRWAGLEAAQVIGDVPSSSTGMVAGKLAGTPIEQRRWARQSLYNRAPLFVRAAAYFLYRYFFRLGFLDGVEGLIFHGLQGLWFRFYVDARIWELWRGRG